MGDRDDLVEDAEVSHLLWEVIADELLALDQLEDSLSHVLDGLTLRLGQDVQLSPQSCLQSERLNLRLDKSVQNTLAFLVDKHDSDKK